ncbi:hypothetical protein JOC76_004050 [Neobacillus cucumis]|nr:hypothetical protein [Neobacillus cucumis]
MKRFILSLFSISIFCIYPLPSKASTFPCSMVLEPTDKKLENSKGTALIYKVRLRPFC